jgi:hypothetical protein
MDDSKQLQRPSNYDVWKKLKGRCISCGYLCKRIDLMTSTNYEASIEDRNYGNLLSHPESQRQTRIWCYRNIQVLYKEYLRLTNEYRSAKDNAEINFEIITRDIKCPLWFEYVPFMSPKEHFEEQKLQLLEQDRRKFESKLTGKYNRALIVLTIALLIIAVLQIVVPHYWH